MAATDASVKQLQLQISASTELLIRNLKQADSTVAEFRRHTDRNLDQIDGRFHKLGESIGGSLRGAIGGAIGALAGVSLIEVTRQSLDFADAIADLSDRTGASTKFIQEFRYAAQLSGSSVDTADAAVDRFTKTLGLAQAGSKAQAEELARLGVTATDFDTAFRQTVEGISKLGTVQERNAAILRIFGKEAGTLTQLIGEGAEGFDTLAAKARELGVVLDDQLVRSAGQVNDQLDTMQLILSTKLAGFVAENASGIAALADSFGRLAAEALGAVNAIKAYTIQRGINLEQNTLDGWLSTEGMKDAARARINGYRNLLADTQPDRTDLTFDPVKRRFVQASKPSGSMSPPLSSVPRAATAGAAKARRSGAGTRGGTSSKPASLADRLKAEADGSGSYISAELSAAGSDVNALVASLGGVDQALAGIRTGLEGVNVGDILTEDEQLRLEGFTENFRRDLADGLAQATIFGGDLGDVLVNSLRRASAELLSSGLLDLLSGKKFGSSFGGAGVTKVIGGLFGGAFAAGGDPPLGKISLVGEDGPELFVPKVNGTIIPNHALGGASSTTLHVSVDARGASDPQSVQRAVAAGIAEAAPYIRDAAVSETLRIAGRPHL